MSIYVTSDLHLSLSVDKPMYIFGDKWIDHHIKIKNDWEDKVLDNDTVIIVGDISWGINLEEAMLDLEWIDKLPGKKILSKGNHDYWWESMAKLNKNFPRLNFLQNNSYVVENIGIIGTRSWISPFSNESDLNDKKIYERELHRLGLSINHLKSQKNYSDIEKIYCFIHYPPFDDKIEKTGMVKLLEDFNSKSDIKITNVFFGHVHSFYEKVKQGNFNNINYEMITCDYKDFKLVKIN